MVCRGTGSKFFAAEELRYLPPAASGKWGGVSLSIALEADAGSLVRRQKKPAVFAAGFLTGITG
jgi:hypothetical protein